MRFFSGEYNDGKYLIIDCNHCIVDTNKININCNDLKILA